MPKNVMELERKTVNSYTQEDVTGKEDEGSEVLVRFPKLSSLKWFFKLYAFIFCGLCLFLSIIWIIFQLFVLSQTRHQELILQRYGDIFVGLLLLSSFLCLLYGANIESKLLVATFFTLFSAAMLVYWALFGYFNLMEEEFTDSEPLPREVTGLLTVILSISLLPLLLFYKILDEDQQ